MFQTYKFQLVLVLCLTIFTACTRHGEGASPTISPTTSGAPANKTESPAAPVLNSESESCRQFIGKFTVQGQAEGDATMHFVASSDGFIQAVYSDGTFEVMDHELHETATFTQRSKWCASGQLQGFEVNRGLTYVYTYEITAAGYEVTTSVAGDDYKKDFSRDN